MRWLPREVFGSARGTRFVAVLAVASMGFAEASCGTSSKRAEAQADSSPDADVFLVHPSDAGSDAEAPGSPPAYFVGAGDMADCMGVGDERTAALLDGIPGTVFTLGDNVYENGTADEFVNCYEPTWGRHKERTKPVVGNHDYNTKGAAPYFAYFGAAAGDPTRGYYSYDVGAWHIVALNSNCGEIGGCDEASPQMDWLRNDLAANREKKCTAALWHHPRFSTGNHGNEPAMQPIWNVLFDENVDLVLAGHDHSYQRWAPLDANGKVDTSRGIRSFVIGTGGRSFNVAAPEPRIEALDYATWGVVKFSLRETSYEWEFVAEPGKSFSDRGQGICH